MNVRFAQWVRQRPLRRGIILACAALVLAAGISNLAGYVRFRHFADALDRSLAPEPTGRTINVGWSFPFESGRPMVTVSLDEAEIEAAAALDTSAVFGSRGWLRDAYVARLITAEATSPVVERLVGEFRRIREERRLDDDRYLEMMATAVQSIPYGDVTGEIMLPAEVLAAGSGVCTEKSVLLAAVLVHEGYDAVLWVFPTQRHVALGVRSDGARFRDTPYAFVETTVDAFVGQSEASFRSSGPIVRPPRQIALGGWRAYGSGRQVEFILAELGRAESITANTGRYARWATLGGTHGRRYAERANEHWAASTTAAFILGNTHDRRDVYAILAAGGVPETGSPQLLF